MHRGEAVVAFDLDEVVFPFAREYSRWRETQGLATFDPEPLTTYDFAATLGDAEADSGHTSAFIADPRTLRACVPILSTLSWGDVLKRPASRAAWLAPWVPLSHPSGTM
jgi:hypothetical protein